MGCQGCSGYFRDGSGTIHLKGKTDRSNGSKATRIAYFQTDWLNSQLRACKLTPIEGRKNPGSGSIIRS